ncbi:hypothetical protein AGMMS50239_26590 [Bacteroidia bacterium]|nr:hypothetical protein AGMMS50239_26590 [Bacteroidia bacterium]
MILFKQDLKLNEEFGKFFIENYPRVKSFAKRILMSEQDAEDIAQDVFLKLIDKPEIWKDEEKKNNYLYKITKNHIFNLIKHRDIERRYQEELAQKNQVAEEFGLDDKLHAKEIELIIAGVVEQMPEQRKKIFKMSRYEGKANQQIAESLNMSIRTVERHLYLALSDFKKNVKSFLPNAAAVIFITAVSSAFIFTNRISSSSAPGFIEYYSRAEQTDTLTLPDGSLIQVNSGTLVLYPESYGKDTRTVYLYGEANFKVQKNANVPFIVKSRNFSVTALGTEFNVAAYSDESYFKTTLITGSIKVQKNNCPSDSYILTVNEQFVYNEITELHTIGLVDVFETTAWQRGELLFRGATIGEIFSVLERKYAVSFQYKSTMFNDDKYNFRFKKESSLSDIIDVIKKASENFTCHKIGDSYYISE